ncbi:hypothetical protein K9L16_03105 [Candidatus Pacearchaeota archaeon]|nr:hypothetical protein [Candidatus Pacearchaeota archaeon]
MYSRSLINDIRRFELALGIVPTFRGGCCDKSLEGYEGQPMPRHLREKKPTPKNTEPPIYTMHLNSNYEITITNLRPIQQKAYQEEFGDIEFERGTNGAIYF